MARETEFIRFVAPIARLANAQNHTAFVIHSPKETRAVEKVSLCEMGTPE